jgi:hypothetical protein
METKEFNNDLEAITAAWDLIADIVNKYTHQLKSGTKVDATEAMDVCLFLGFFKVQMPKIINDYQQVLEWIESVEKSCKNTDTEDAKVILQWITMGSIDFDKLLKHKE